MRVLACLILLSLPVAAADWPYWRGANADGVSPDEALPATWSPEGENLIWKTEHGGRATPVVAQGQVCMIRLSEPETPSRWQEQVVCLDEKTGEVRWEHRENVFQTDIPHHRVGWANLVADADTGAIYSHSISGVVTGFTADGEVMWTRSLDEEIGRFSGFGGRTVTPILDGDLVIVSFLTAGFGPNFIPRHRFYALDKNSGETVWLSTPGGQPQDTTYSAPIVRVIDGRRLLIAGNGDGGVYAVDVATGETVWGYVFSKRGINVSPVEHDGVVFISHSEENTDGSTAMGRLLALDATEITDGKPKLVWEVDGFAAGYASPAIHDGVLYHVDNSANMVGFDIENGERLWEVNLGIAQKASPVIGDGKLYVADVDGKFHIFRLNGRSEPEKLDEDEFKDADGSAIQINGSPAIAGGRIFLPTNDNLYCIGTPDGKGMPLEAKVPAPAPAPSGAQPAHLQVVPAEVPILAGGERNFTARAFDDQGRLIGEVDAAWSQTGLNGEISADGLLDLAGDNTPQGGVVKATYEGLEAVSQVRNMPKVPYEDDFSGYDVGAYPAGFPAIRGRFEVAELEGERVLFKTSANMRSQKTRVYFGDPDASAYDMEIDVLAKEKARRMPDVGLISHRYTLDLSGNKQRLRMYTWTSEMDRFSAETRFTFDPDVWYSMKFRVVPSEENGPTKLYAKVWKRDEPEPEEWTLEAEDAVGSAHGSPGFWGYALADIYYDNLKVTPQE